MGEYMIVIYRGDGRLDRGYFKYECAAMMYALSAKAGETVQIHKLVPADTDLPDRFTKLKEYVAG